MTNITVCDATDHRSHHEECCPLQQHCNAVLKKTADITVYCVQD